MNFKIIQDLDLIIYFTGELIQRGTNRTESPEPGTNTAKVRIGKQIFSETLDVYSNNNMHKLPMSKRNTRKRSHLVAEKAKKGYCSGSPRGFREQGNMAVKLLGTGEQKENKAGNTESKAVVLIF